MALGKLLNLEPEPTQKGRNTDWKAESAATINACKSSNPRLDYTELKKSDKWQHRRHAVFFLVGHLYSTI